MLGPIERGVATRHQQDIPGGEPLRSFWTGLSLPRTDQRQHLQALERTLPKFAQRLSHRGRTLAYRKALYGLSSQERRHIGFPALGLMSATEHVVVPPTQEISLHPDDIAWNVKMAKNPGEDLDRGLKIISVITFPRCRGSRK